MSARGSPGAGQGVLVAARRGGAAHPALRPASPRAALRLIGSVGLWGTEFAIPFSPCLPASLSRFRVTTGGGGREGRNGGREGRAGGAVLGERRNLGGGPGLPVRTAARRHLLSDRLFLSSSAQVVCMCFLCRLLWRLFTLFRTLSLL